MTAVDRPAPDVTGPLLPDREGFVPRVHGTGGAPEDQDGAADRVPAAVGLVVRHVEGGGGAVLLADGVTRSGSRKVSV